MQDAEGLTEQGFDVESVYANFEISKLVKLFQRRETRESVD